MKRELFDEDHEIYRRCVREFLEREAVPNIHSFGNDEQRGRWRQR